MSIEKSNNINEDKELQEVKLKLEDLARDITTQNEGHERVRTGREYENINDTYIILGNMLDKNPTEYTSKDIETIQFALKIEGYNIGLIDGSYDAKTRKAIEKFQKDNGMRIDGILDAKTISKLRENLRKKW